MHHRFEDYESIEGEVPAARTACWSRRKVARPPPTPSGSSPKRAAFFVGPGVEVYEGMIVGENARDVDMVVNPIREKKLTNMRSSGADDMIQLEASPRPLAGTRP